MKMTFAENGKEKMDKAFSREAQQQAYDRYQGKCARCGCDLRTCWPPMSIHHKKPRSTLTKADIEKHGPGGGVANSVALCGKCHAAVHAREPGTEKYRTRSWQEIGETEGKE